MGVGGNSSIILGSDRENKHALSHRHIIISFYSNSKLICCTIDMHETIFLPLMRPTAKLMARVGAEEK